MRILALSPHTDDIELGCGGYLSRLGEYGHSIYTACFSHVYNGVDLEGEHMNSVKKIGSAASTVYDFKTREFDRQGVLDVMIDLKKGINPEMVLCPSLGDIHQDHKVVAEEAVRAFSKDCTVLSYELTWNCRDFTPNYYVMLKLRHIDHKLEMMRCYESQKDRPYFNEHFIEGLAKVRGQQIRVKLAEAYEIITIIK